MDIQSFIDDINSKTAGKNKGKLSPDLAPLYVLLWNRKTNEVVFSNDPEQIMSFVMMRDKKKMNQLIHGLQAFVDNIKFSFKQQFGEGMKDDDQKPKA